MKRLIILIVAMIFVVSTSLMAGPKGVKLPSYKQSTLKNGLTVFVMEMREVPLVSINLLVPAGSAHDGAGREGEANFTARLLLKGAGGMGADEIAESVEGMGGRLNASATRDYTMITANFMSRDFERALGYLAMVALKPDFPDEEVERERGIIKAEILGEKESPSSIATREFIRAVAGSHPYANPTAGYQASVTAITRDDIVSFHKSKYFPKGSILTIVGEVNVKKALDAVKKSFTSWQGTGAVRRIDPFEAGAGAGRRVIVINKPDATQSQIRIGNIAVGRSTPDYFPLLVGNSLLGGGFTSRLMDEIRVNRGLSYGARSSVYHLRNGGLFLVSTFTKNPTLRETIDVALEQVERMRTEAIGEMELGNTKRYISGLFPFDLETNDDLAEWLTEIEFYGLPKDLAGKYRAKIDEVSSEDIMRVAKEHFHASDCLILVLTNYEETKDQLAGLGKIEVVDIDEIE